MSARAILGAVFLDGRFWPRVVEIGWSDLGNWTVWFDGYHGLVLSFVLVSSFTSKTLPCSAATSSGLFSVSGFALSLAKISLLSPVCP
jgi:hypothetical protein